MRRGLTQTIGGHGSTQVRFPSASPCPSVFLVSSRFATASDPLPSGFWGFALMGSADADRERLPDVGRDARAFLPRVLPM